MRVRYFSVSAFVGAIVATVSTQAAEIALVPVGATGEYSIVDNEIFLFPVEQQVTLEIFLSGWTPDELGSYQATVDASTYASGDGDPLAPLTLPDASAGCYLDAARSDYVFQGIDSMQGASTADPDYSYYGLTMGTCKADNGATYYGGTLILEVPSTADGTYTIQLLANEALTVLDDCGVSHIPRTLASAVIRVGALVPPAPEPGGPACNVDGDCVDDWAGATCVTHVCYVPKNRYISVDPTSNGTNAVAYKVTLTETTNFPECVGEEWWMEAPQCFDRFGYGVEPPPDPSCVSDDMFGWVSRLSSTPQAARVWTENPVHIGDRGIVPVAVYSIEATVDGGATFSTPLEIMTIRKPASVEWGDVTGAGSSVYSGWSPPDGVVDEGDDITVRDAFIGWQASPVIGQAPMAWADLSRDVPDARVNLEDCLSVRDAMAGEAYPWVAPCDHCTGPEACDDDLYCNGLETCGDGNCQPGTPPCAPDEDCDEVADVCSTAAAIITCVPDTETPPAGGMVKAVFYVENVTGLTGYQLEYAATRTSGIGEISSYKFWYEYPDLLFFFDNLRAAASHEDKRMLGYGLYASTEDATTPRPLVHTRISFSGDAEGSTFDISAVHEPGTLLRDINNDPIPYVIGSPCTVTIGPPDCDTDGIPDSEETDPLEQDHDTDGICNTDEIFDCHIEDTSCHDCNSNGIPDEADIADCPVEDESCQDCNDNGIPDGCELDAMCLSQPWGCSQGSVASDIHCDACTFTGIEIHADKFMNPGGPISGVRFWGQYNDGTVQPHREDEWFAVIIREDDAGLPGTAIHTVTGPPTTHTGTVEYTMQMNVGELEGPGPFWLEIYANSSGSGFGYWRWWRSCPRDDCAAKSSYLPEEWEEDCLRFMAFEFICDDLDDCDSNLIPDDCDIADCPPEDSFCQDCNQDGVQNGCEPDPLEWDCDNNSICNGDEIAACQQGDPSCEDCNANGIPDGCESGCEEDSAENIPPNEAVTLNPGGGSADPAEEPQVTFETSSTGASISVTETASEIHPEVGGFASLGSSLIIDTNLDDGTFIMTISIAFTEDDLLAVGFTVADDLEKIDVKFFDESTGTWELAVEGNCGNPPACDAGAIGTRTQVTGTETPVPPTAPLGDYGVFFNTSTRAGYSFAIVDHTTDFALATPLTPAVFPPLAAGGDHAAPKNRYISIDATTNPEVEVAYEVTVSSMRRCSGDDRRACIVDGDCPGVCDNDNDLQCSDDGICGGGTCLPTDPCIEHSDVGSVVKYLDTPYVNSCIPLADCATQWFAQLTDSPVYRVWTENAVHVLGCQIVPVAVYDVRATVDTVLFSDPLTIGTIPKPHVHYADCVGPVVGGAYTAPDGFTNVTDVQAFLAAQGGAANAPHTTWVDLQSGSLPVVPQQILNVGDLQTIKAGFTGSTYVNTPGHENPGDCP